MTLGGGVLKDTLSSHTHLSTAYQQLTARELDGLGYFEKVLQFV